MQDRQMQKIRTQRWLSPKILRLRHALFWTKLFKSKTGQPVSFHGEVASRIRVVGSNRVCICHLWNCIWIDEGQALNTLQPGFGQRVVQFDFPAGRDRSWYDLETFARSSFSDFDCAKFFGHSRRPSLATPTTGSNIAWLRRADLSKKADAIIVDEHKPADSSEGTR